MTELFLVRHGETEWSRDGRHTSVTDLELTTRGEDEARKLFGHLDPNKFGLVLSSPRRRALRTAELAGFIGFAEPEVDEDLVEWGYGDYEGRTSAQIHTEVPGWTVFTHPAPHGEPADRVGARLDRVVERVRRSGAERAICFGHGHALRALTLRWLGLDFPMGIRFPLQTGTVSVLGEEKGQPALEQWNANPSGRFAGT